ncbi:MAG TPA: hypothetical protein VHT91_12020 [Kofleriaceae bacterium]|jgi:hypothetical protein|nr:hypothetical protein [Kofleriaceae bacterium]
MSRSLSSSRFSLRSGAVLFSLLASLGACATIETPRHGFATAATVEPLQAAPWGFAAVAAPSQTAQHGYARAPEPAQPAVWGYAELPAQRATVTQATR